MNRRPRFRTALVAAVLLASLSGCAAAAIPVLAGGVLGKTRLDRPHSRYPNAVPALPPVVTVLPPLLTPEPVTPEPAVSGTAGSVPAASQSEVASELPPVGTAPAAGARVASAEPQAGPIPQPPAELAPPQQLAAATAPPGDGIQAFARYASGRAPPPPNGSKRRSAFVDQDTVTTTPRWLDCANQPPAVLIDLDPVGGTFDPDDPPSPAPGLAEQLAAMRASGLTVLWASSLGVAAAPKVWTVLQATGLDPDRTDRLLLVRRSSERKQTRRIAAARDWCVVAMAGDSRGDFDELFDFLIDPNGPVATAFAPNFGDGWFLIPKPIS